jgi:hypothetical protein
MEKIFSQTDLLDKKENIENVCVPEGVIGILPYTFKGCKNLKSIELPLSLKCIGKHAFLLCSNLINIKLPKGLKTIEWGAFRDCLSLINIEIHKEVKLISGFSFDGCRSLEYVKLHEGLEMIDNRAFGSCLNLKEITLPHSLKGIGHSAFVKCNSLKTIVVPGGVKIIDKFAFAGCGSLEKVEICEGVEVISSYAFDECPKLKDVILPLSLKKIDEHAFSYCKNLKRITIPGNVKRIEQDTFSGCLSLEMVDLCEGVETISECAFNECCKLQNIVLPQSLKIIDKAAFSGCESLGKIIIPGSVEKIGKDAFINCQSLENVVISEGVEIIGEKAFEGCLKLKKIILPKSLKIIENGAFDNCESLESIEIPSQIEYIPSNIFSSCNELKNITFKNINCVRNNPAIHEFNYFYINVQTKELVCSMAKIDNLSGYEEINLQEIKDIQSLLLCSQLEAIAVLETVGFEDFNKMGNIKYLLSEILKDYDLKTFRETHREIINNCDKFNNMLKQIRKFTQSDFINNRIEYANIFNLAHTLGAFSDSEKDRQSACEFISTAFQQGYFDMHMIHGSFEMIKDKNYSSDVQKEWTQFFLNKNNFKQLLEIEKEQAGYITKVYHSFLSIREFGRKSKGSQNYRQVTIDMCNEYFDKFYFNDVNGMNEDIAEELIKYSDLRTQETFDDAVKIRNEYLQKYESGEIKSHILGEELKEKDVFTQIEEARKNSLNDVNDALNLLDELANKRFTYEFLSKYDAQNFVLGKYCSCCAHLEGAGYGIMKASILHPDCQNLVIRDKNGNIIAKSTLYVNRKQGYGLFNNVEIDNNIKDEETLNFIYKKYMKAIEDFANRYNELNQNNPLKIITVGMSLNDLSEQIVKNREKSQEILKGILFSSYGKEGQRYDGDWKNEQYIVWNVDDKKGEKKDGR